MNRDLNHATRRLLQVILDMLRVAPEQIESIKASARSGYEPPVWRCEQPCVEAAWRAAKEAQQMLAEAQSEPMLWPDGAKAPVPLPRPPSMASGGDS